MWFYQTANGGEVGPIGAQKLLDMIRSGEVLRNTQLRKDDSQWVSAGDVNGLWDAADKPSMAYFCPNCNRQIAKPRARCEKCKTTVDNPKTKVIHHDLEEVARKARTAAHKPTVPPAPQVQVDGASRQPGSQDRWLGWIRRQKS